MPNELSVKYGPYGPEDVQGIPADMPLDEVTDVLAAVFVADADENPDLYLGDAS